MIGLERVHENFGHRVENDSDLFPRSGLRIKPRALALGENGNSISLMGRKNGSHALPGGYRDAASPSAISSSFVTVFQFRPVPGVPSALSIFPMGSWDLPTPLR